MEPDAEQLAPNTAASRRWLTRGVGSVGLASFFSDSGHEIATSVLPSLRHRDAALVGGAHSG